MLSGGGKLSIPSAAAMLISARFPFDKGRQQAQTIEGSISIAGGLP
jgi:hypothetical protein